MEIHIASGNSRIPVTHTDSIGSDERILMERKIIHIDMDAFYALWNSGIIRNFAEFRLQSVTRRNGVS